MAKKTLVVGEGVRECLGVYLSERKYVCRHRLMNKGRQGQRNREQRVAAAKTFQSLMPSDMKVEMETIYLD